MEPMQPRTKNILLASLIGLIALALYVIGILKVIYSTAGS